MIAEELIYCIKTPDHLFLNNRCYFFDGDNLKKVDSQN